MTKTTETKRLGPENDLDGFPSMRVVLPAAHSMFFMYARGAYAIDQSPDRRVVAMITSSVHLVVFRDGANLGVRFKFDVQKAPMTYDALTKRVSLCVKNDQVFASTPYELVLHDVAADQTKVFPVETDLCTPRLVEVCGCAHFLVRIGKKASLFSIEMRNTFWIITMQGLKRLAFLNGRLDVCIAGDRLYSFHINELNHLLVGVCTITRDIDASGAFCENKITVPECPGASEICPSGRMSDQWHGARVAYISSEHMAVVFEHGKGMLIYMPKWVAVGLFSFGSELATLMNHLTTLVPRRHIPFISVRSKNRRLFLESAHLSVTVEFELPSIVAADNHHVLFANRVVYGCINNVKFGFLLGSGARVREMDIVDKRHLVISDERGLMNTKIAVMIIDATQSTPEFLRAVKDMDRVTTNYEIVQIHQIQTRNQKTRRALPPDIVGMIAHYAGY